MKYKIMFIALLIAVFAFSGVAFAGDGSDYRQLQETEVFFNNSGSVLSSGMAVILDTSATAGTTLGGYITVVSGADSVLVVGVIAEVQTTIAVGSPGIIVVRGPVDTLVNDKSDAVSSGASVGTSIKILADDGPNRGYVGGGSNLGIALEAGDATDGDKIIIWIAPTGAD